jgi:antirestriction protein ArdC
MKPDVYERITAKIVADLEQGVRPWLKPWNAEHAAGRITRPLRSNGIPYRGINTVMLWMDAMEKGYAAPIWMTFKQALELGAHVRKGEKGSLVVYADTITRTETDKDTVTVCVQSGQPAVEDLQVKASLREVKRRRTVDRDLECTPAGGHWSSSSTRRQFCATTRVGPAVLA